MRRFIGIMYAMTVTPRTNIQDYWSVEADGLRPASNFESFLRMSYSRFCQIRKMFAIGQNIITKNKFDNFRHIQDMFNERMHTVFKCCNRIVVDESTPGWHAAGIKKEFTVRRSHDSKARICFVYV